MRAVEHLHAHQHIGDGQLQARELDALARQSLRPRVDPAPFDEQVRELAHNGLFQVLHTVRKLQDNGQPHARQNRRAPQDAELAGRGFFDLEIGRARLVRRRRKRHEQQREQLPGEQPPEACCHRLMSRPRPIRRESAGCATCRRLPMRSRRRGQQHGVLRAHVLVRLVPRQRLLLGEPGCFHVALDFLEIGHAAWDHGVHEHQMPAEPGLESVLARSRATISRLPARNAARTPSRGNPARGRGNTPGT